MFKTVSFNRVTIWYVIVALLFISFPWSERINSVFILLLVIHWLADNKLVEKITQVKNHWKNIWPFWSFFALHLLFLYKTHHWQDAMHTIEVKLSWLILPCLLATENYFNHTFQHRLFKLFCLSCLLSALYCVLAYYIHIYPINQWSLLFDRMYFSLYIMHPGYYSNFFVIAVIYLWLQLFQNKHMTQKETLLSSCLVILFLVTLFILVSKTAIIVLVLFFIYFIWKKLESLQQRMLKYLLFISVTVLTIFLFSQVPNINKRITETIHDIEKIDHQISFANSTGSRIAAWKLEWDIIQENPFWGHGTGNANSLLISQFEKGQYADLITHQMHTHNQLLHTWIDLGLLGLLSLLFMFISSFIYFYKNNQTMGMWTVVLLFVYSATDDALEIQSITVFCTFLICLLLFENKKQTLRSLQVKST